uniref:VWFA domain-containing protein n=1 Tax=Petromyzon marinus TaxID=7757 RepID=S4RED1_PETMA
DLVFLIDGSTSVEQQTFHLIKKFVERIITNYYYIGGSLRVAVYQFGGAGRLEVPLGNQNDADSLTHTISNIEKVSGPRNLGASLTYVLSNIYKETTTTKLSQRGNVQQSIFIISGGKSDDDVTGAVQLLRERGITVTGVGHTSSQLDAVVSTSSHWFKFTESGTILKSFYNIISGLFFTATQSTLHRLQPFRSPMSTRVASANRELTVLIRTPQAISKLPTFRTVRTIVSQIITGLQVGPDNTRVALVTIGGTPKVDIFLNSLSGKAELLTAVEKLVPVGGPLNLGAALQVVVNSVLKPEKGSRIHLGAPTMLVTILGGKPADDVSGSVVTLNGLGVRHVVLSGGYQDTKVLDSIATSSRLVKTWSSFQSILNFNLGHFVYKTSLLHRQVQMILLLQKCSKLLTNSAPIATVFNIRHCSTVHPVMFDHVRTIVSQIIAGLDVGPDSTRVALVTVGGTPRADISFNSFPGKAELLAAVGKLAPAGGPRNLGAALQLVANSVLKPDKGSRSQLGSTTIVYTILGGKPADDVTAGASLLR